MRHRRTAFLLLLAALAACTAPAPAPPAADFGVSLSDTVLEAVPGSGTTTSITLSPTNGFSGAVALGLANRDGSPSDPGLTLTPDSIVISESAVSGQSIQRQLTLAADAAVPTGSYQLRLIATSGSLGSDADLDLTVAASLIPSVEITNPSEGTIVTSSREVTVEGTISAVAGVVEVLIEGADSVTDVTFDDSGFSATATLGNNTNALTATVQDARGRLGTSESVEITFPYLDLETFQRAGVVIGQPDFGSRDPNQGGAAGANTVFAPQVASAIAPDGTLFVPDSVNDRVLAFASVPNTNNATADFVLGQDDFTSISSGIAADAFQLPYSVATDGSRLAVADTLNNRVLIWNQIPNTTGVPADVVVGQPDFLDAGGGCNASSLIFPTSARLAGGRLIVNDWLNQRILIWNSVPTTNGAPADIVLGQATFTTCAANDADQDGATDAAPTSRTLSGPLDVWSDGERLITADASNNRVLLWNQIPASSFTPADLVVGQPDFTSFGGGSGADGFLSPRGVASNGNQLFVADYASHRVMIFDTLPSQNGAAADAVLGQASFANIAFNDDDQDNSSDTVTSRTLYNPYGLTVIDGGLLVSDINNNRVLLFESR